MNWPTEGSPLPLRSIIESAQTKRPHFCSTQSSSISIIKMANNERIKAVHQRRHRHFSPPLIVRSAAAVMGVWSEKKHKNERAEQAVISDRRQQKECQRARPKCTAQHSTKTLGRALALIIEQVIQFQFKARSLSLSFFQLMREKDRLTIILFHQVVHTPLIIRLSALKQVRVRRKEKEHRNKPTTTLCRRPALEHSQLQFAILVFLDSTNSHNSLEALVQLKRRLGQPKV